jgi:hypothetical protein
MGRRLELQALLEDIAPHVYHQAPPSTGMQYPCIIYERDNADTKFAGNRPYSFRQRYQVTIIDRNPDSDILEKIARLPLCLYDRHFVANNLNHDVFSLFY